MHVGLVAGVPQQDVPGRREDPVQGQGQLDRTQVGAQVAARCRHRLHDEAADLLGQSGQLVAVELAEVGRGVDRLQQHRLRLPLVDRVGVGGALRQDRFNGRGR